jgi:hypothetical protein
VLIASGSGHLFNLLIVAGVAVGSWLVVLELLAMATRPRQPPPGPAVLVDTTTEAEPPALVSFLTNHWAVGPEAAPATLIDLAARHYLTIDEVDPDHFMCRLRAGPTVAERLTPYEEQVLDRVRSLGVDGSVPCEALATGTAEDAGPWRKRFDRAVVADARARGLSRGRWTKASYAVLGLTALAPAAGIGAVLAAASADKARTPGQHHSGAGDAFWAAVVAWALLMALTSAFRAQRETPAGSAAAARWLGLKAHLHADETFPTLPPAAVAIWDRYLAYGAALGLAAAAVHSLPMGPESDREAWSSFGGRWRLVRIHYPRYLRPGWGWHPAKAIAVSLLGGAVAIGLARLVLSGLADALLGEVRSARVSVLWAVSVGMTVIVLGAVGYAFVAAGKLLSGGLADLASRRDVEGMVLRARKFDDRCYVAVDEGRARKLWAWRVRPEIYSGLSEHAGVTGRVSDHLGYVWRLVPVTAPSPTPREPVAGSAGVAVGPRGSGLGSGPAAPTACPIDAATVRSVTGCDLEQLSEGDAVGLRALAGRARLVEGAEYGAQGVGHVMVGVVEGSALDGLFGPLGWVPHRLRREVPGVGEEAFWLAGTTLIARKEGRTAIAVVALHHAPADRRLEMARALILPLLGAPADRSLASQPERDESTKPA